MFVSGPKLRRKQTAKPVDSGSTAGAISSTPASRPPPPYDSIYPSQPTKQPNHGLQLPKPPRPKVLPAKPQRPQAWTRPRKASLATTSTQSKPSISIDIVQQDTIDQVADEALYGLISSKLDSVITSIDEGDFKGDVQELEISEQYHAGIRGGWGFATRGMSGMSQGANRAISSAVISTNYFSKVKLYANSRLPANLPPLQIYLPSYPLLCLAAQYSQRAYAKPTCNEREAFVNADWRMGTKAMFIKSVPIDDMNCIVFAIRGTQTFMDWAVNLNSTPASPTDFLDDTGNLCHSGFLSVARKMIKPVAARLRSLLEENPSRSSCSLLITGHSAGGAVASLLFAHMVAEVARSELNTLTGCFKRIHCLTFGTPPVSLLPLAKPTTLRYKKSLFMSFINEGDPVPRADKAYVRSLLNLYTSPAPGSSCITSLPLLKPCKQLKHKKAADSSSLPLKAYVWKVPPGTLSNAGRLVVLREQQNQGNGEPVDDVKAEVTSDQELRNVIFGDPVMHMMKVYARRVEILATKAVTAKVWG